MAQIAEMHYYTVVTVKVAGTEISQTLALASLYGPRDEDLYRRSSETYWTAKHLHKLQFIPVQSIKQLVMMAPDPQYGVDHTDGSEEDRWYMMQKPGAALFNKMGLSNEEPDLDNDQEEI